MSDRVGGSPTDGIKLRRPLSPLAGCRADRTDLHPIDRQERLVWAKESSGTTLPPSIVGGTGFSPDTTH